MQNLIIGCILGIFIAYVIHKWAIPNIPENVKNKVKDNIWSFVLAIIILAGIMLFLFLPLAFKFWAINVWGIPTENIQGEKVLPLELTDLGPLGDIYGSLNTLFTSITLGIVAYTAGLQRKANMHTFNSNQMQINETKYSNFSNLFYSLLNHKQSKYNNLKISNETTEFNAIRLFSGISSRLLRLLRTEWSDSKILDSKVVKAEHHKLLISLTKKSSTAHELNSYFLIYGDLFNLINRSELDNNDKEFFKEIVRNSMTVTEQVTLFWMGAYNNRYKVFLKDSGIFNQFYHVNMFTFAKKFYDETYFSHPKILENWDNQLENQNPT